MGREFELKYRAEDAQLEALKAAFSGFHAISMETTYYDTPDGDLGALRWTLRRRFENGEAVCTMKTPEVGGLRGEWEVRCDRIEEATPALCKLGAPDELMALAQKGLKPTCGARFTRLAALVKAEGCTLEIALDRGVLLGGGKEIPLSEAEVELKEGSEDAARAFAEAIAADFGLVPEPKSKVQRAMELANSK